MAYRELELTLLSAQGLKNVNLITRMDVYAVVTISGDPLTRQCTPPDISGGRNPCWNATLRFAVPPTAAEASGACLHVLLRAERVLGDRDVGEVVVPLADLLATAPAKAAHQQPQLASYQVRKLHRWEPRGVLNVAYRLGPVIAPVVEPPPQEKPVVAYPVQGVPASHPPPPPPRDVAKPFQPRADAYPPTPPRRPAEREEARARAPPSPAPAPRNGGKSSSSNGGIGREGPTQVCVGPHTQIILGGGGPATAMSPTGSNVSSPRTQDGGAWPKQSLHHHHHHHVDDTTAHYASSAQSMFSPRKEDDRSRPQMFSHSQHDTPQQVSHQRALVPAAFHREPATSPRRPPVSTFSSHGSSSSPPPYSPAYPFTPSPTSSSSARSFASSPHSSAHPSTPSPRRLGQSAIGGDAFGAKTSSHTDSLLHSSASSRRAPVSSPLQASSPLVANNHSGMVPSTTPSPRPLGSHTNSPRSISTH